MGGKGKPQRTKGNLQPSSSGRAVELMSRDGTIGFVGFSGLTSSPGGGLGLTPVVDADASNSVNSDFHIVMKKMMKRDAVTKLKAVQEFGELCKTSSEEDVLNVLPFWPRIYNRLAMDVDHRVREGTQQAMEQLVLRVGRKLAPHLKAIIGSWLCAQSDPYAPVASAASKSFQAVFSESKRMEALMFCKEEIIQHMKDNLIKQTADTLSDPKLVEVEEREAKYIRVMASSLMALHQFLSSCSQEVKSSFREDLEELFSEKRFWKYSKHKSPLIRNSMFSFLAVSCQQIPDQLEPFLPQLTPTILGAVDDLDPVVCRALWDAALSLLNYMEGCWTHVNARKAVLPKLWNLLRQGGHGSAVIIYPCLLPFLSKVPAEIIGDGIGFYGEFFSNMKDGLLMEYVLASSSESTSVINSFIECLKYVMIKQTDKETDQDELLNLLLSQVIIIVKLSLSGQLGPCSTLVYSKMGDLINSVQTQISSGSSNLKQILEKFWTNMKELTVEYITNQNDHELQQLVLCFKCLKSPQSQFKSKNKGVKFSEEKHDVEKLEQDQISTDDNKTEQNIEELYNGQLINAVCELCKRCLLKSTEVLSVPHIKPLCEIFSEFPCSKLFHTLLETKNSENTAITNINSEMEDIVALGKAVIYDILLPWIHEINNNSTMQSKEQGRVLEYLIDMVLAVVGVLTDQGAEILDDICKEVNNIKIVYKLIKKCSCSKFPCSNQWISGPCVGQTVVGLTDKLYTILSLDHQSDQAPAENGDVVTLCNIVSVFLTFDGSTPNVEHVSHVLNKLQQILKLFSKKNISTHLPQVLDLINSYYASCSKQLRGFVPGDELLIVETFNVRFTNFSKSSVAVQELLNMTWHSALELLSSVNNDIGPVTESLCAVVMDLLLSCDSIDRISLLVKAVVDLLNIGNQSKLSKLLDKVLPAQANWIKERTSSSQQVNWQVFILFSGLLPYSHRQPNSSTITGLPGTLTSHENLALFSAQLVQSICTKMKNLPNFDQIVENKLIDVLLELLWCQCWCSSLLCQNVKSQGEQKCLDIIKPFPNQAHSVKHLESLLSLLDEPINTLLCTIDEQDKRQILVERMLQVSGTEGGLWAVCAGTLLGGYRQDSQAVLSSFVQQTCYDKVDKRTLHSLCAVIPQINSILDVKILTEQNIKFLTEDGKAVPSVNLPIINKSIERWIQLAKVSEEAGLELHLTVLEVISEIMAWKEQHGDSLLFDTSLINVPSDVIGINTAVMGVIRSTLLCGLSDITSEQWDFILCSIVGWLQTCQESLHLLHSSLEAQTFVFHTCQLASVIIELSEDPRPSPPDSTNSQALSEELIQEWNEFFSMSIYDTLFSLFLKLADHSMSVDMKPTTAHYSLCSMISCALHRMPLGLLTNHKLSTTKTKSASVTPPWAQTLLNRLSPLLLCHVTSIQITAFSLLSRIIPELANVVDMTKETQDDEDQLRPPPSELLSILQTSSSEISDILSEASVPFGECLHMSSDTEAQSVSLSYLLVWKLLLNLFKSSDQENRVPYAAYLRQNKLLTVLLDRLYRLMPAVPVLRSISGDIDIEPALVVCDSFIHCLSVSIYYGLLQFMPALVRGWWNSLDKKRAGIVDRFTSANVSPLLSEQEIEAVQHSSCKFTNMTVKARPMTREVVAVYTVDEISMELVVSLSANHPLGVVTVDSGKRVGVSAGQWRQWMLQMVTFLSHQNGTIMEGLTLWKKNVDKKFEGVDDCMICFSVIHGTNYSLPKISCKTCKKRYHNACLYKWFSTSNNATCPLCRNIF